MRNALTRIVVYLLDRDDNADFGQPAPLQLVVAIDLLESALSLQADVGKRTFEFNSDEFADSWHYFICINPGISL